MEARRHPLDLKTEEPHTASNYSPAVWGANLTIAMANWRGWEIFRFYILAQRVHSQMWGFFRILQIFKINQLKLSSKVKSDSDGKLTFVHRSQTEKNSVNWSKEKRSSKQKKWMGEWTDPGDPRKHMTIFLNLLYKNTE